MSEVSKWGPPLDVIGKMNRELNNEQFPHYVNQFNTMSVYLLKLGPVTPGLTFYTRGKLVIYHAASEYGRELFLTTTQTHLTGTAKWEVLGIKKSVLGLAWSQLQQANRECLPKE